MSPELFSVFGVPVYAYRTMLAIAFVVCTLLTVRASRTRAGGREVSPIIGIWAMFGSLVGAHAFFIVQYGDPRDVWRAVFVWEGGLVFYGGLIGGVLAAWSYLAWVKVPFLNAADSAAPYLALGEAIARVGCLLNGCCWGAACHLPWAIAFPKFSSAFAAQVGAGALDPSAAQSLPVHPTQLYMTIGLVAAAIALGRMLVRRRADGVVFFGYLVLYGLLRFFVEWVRGDSARSVGGLTVSGAISAGLVVLGASACVYALRRPGSVSE
ncbi:MAG: prolipoprotein diacylglyceryl transferase [Candidatus Hydrogenedentes bacterium]|nr:prolipoprotein diacylglyceryl transferase [Candidatus Hydrogenedentota bacterium]